MELKSGVTLHNNYRIIRVLGQGGFGITYLAEHMLLEQPVAIKEFFPKALCNRDANTSNVRPGTQANTEQVEKLKKKFLKEATHIAKLSNPNIIRIRDVFEQNDTAYYVMDYIDGYTLDVPIKEHGPMPVSQALKYINEIGQALSYVHSKHLNHLDVKPGNIIIRKSDDTAILLDFGLSKQYDTTGHETSSTPIGVSHGYAPIEQYQEGGVKEFSPQTDLYSLAATFYYLIAGRTPDHATKIVENGLYLPGTIPPHIAQALHKAMSTSRKHRHESIQDFLNDINTPDSGTTGEQTVIAGEMPANNAPAASEKSTPKQSKTGLWVLLGVVLAVVAGAIVFFSIRYFESDSRDDSDYDNEMVNSADNAVAEERIIDVTEDDVARADRYYDAQDYSKALNIYLQAAQKGILENYNRLGWMYQYGQGTPQDFTEAAKWYHEGAIRGDAKAQRNLGILYRYGNGVKQDDEKAARLYRQAADQGDANAQNNLGYMYMEGLGVPQSYSMALDWFQKAANQGYTRSKFHLGYMYYYGLGVPEDYERAHRLMSEASDEGDQDAREWLDSGMFDFAE